MGMDTTQFDELKSDPKNPRIISDHDGSALAESMKRWGDLSCIVFNVRTKQLVGGHQRIGVLTKVLAGAKKVEITQRFETPDSVGTVGLGYVLYEGRQFAYREVDWPESEQRAANIAANRIQGEFKLDMLAEVTYELSQLENGAELLALTGQTDAEISSLLDSVGANGEADAEDDVPELDLAGPPVSQLGEIYQLGAHRLMCGDATNLDHVEALMGGQKAQMIFTDPPYNVDYEGKTADALTIQNDKFETAQQFYAFLLDSFTNMAVISKPGAAIYICHADSEGLNFRKAMLAAGWLLKQNIVWVKNTMVLGRQDYQWQHEPILYGWKDGGPHYFVEDRAKTTVWDDLKDFKTHLEDGYTVIKIGGYEVKIKGKAEGQIRKSKTKMDIWHHDKPSRSEDHPTMKPLSLITEALLNSSQRGWVVVDTFGGSGSTLIACEENGRVCDTLELDPRYVDVIRKRYAAKVGLGDWVTATPIVGKVTDPAENGTVAAPELPESNAPETAPAAAGELTDVPE